ncbi:MAG TPA: NfeD family protein, partial [Cyclobacteriaceae bacterium]|nr:NfeD family protein [Cyclobacteriaceae bacterium]
RQYLAFKVMYRLTLLICLLTTISAYSQKKKVMVMEIKSEIDPRMKRYVDLAIDHAIETKADIVIIEMDTYGGILTDAKEIVDKLMDFKNPVWVFINSDAASAGALISIACDSIYMSPGASIGAATVVDGSGEKAPDKYQSYMRSIMRSTAEENGRDPRIAEGMVDEDVEIDSITEKGKIITFSTSEAIKHGYCEGKVGSIEEILQKNNIGSYEIDRFELSRSEKVIAFFLNPFISGVLILIILAGIYFEMQTPGVGFPGLAALIGLILYLVPYYLNGLAANWEIIAFFIGVGLLAIEIFILPGFGIAGVSGISLIVMSLILIMVDNDFFNFDFVPQQNILLATAATLGGILGAIGLLFYASSRLSDSAIFKRVALTDTQERSQGYTSSFNKEPMKGKKGIAYTVLRPSGKVMIDEQIYDAYTRGDYIDKDIEVEVVNDEGTSLQVKRIT